MATGGGGALEKLSLFLSGRNLFIKGILRGNPNAFAIVSKVDGSVKIPKFTTEVITNQTNVDWSANISIDFNFDRQELYVIDVYSQEGTAPVTDIAKHVHIGSTNFLVSNLLRAPAQTLMLPLPGFERSNIVVRAEMQANSRDNFVATFSASKLCNKEGFFSTSDPFLEISRQNEDGSWSIVWKNNHIDSTLNPRWSETKLSIVLLCNGDIDRPLRVTIWDWEKSGRHKFMGRVDTSVRELVTIKGAPLNVIEPEKQKKSSYKNSGTFSAGNCSIEHNPTFGDFVGGGCEISLVVAIDFTASNGEPNTPTSLHYLNPSGQPNQYQQVIQSVGSILETYDTDKKFPVYGFGARVRLPDGSQSPAQHCFPIYGGDVEVFGVGGILKAYVDGVPNVIFSGPTLFAPVINKSAQIAASKIASGQQCYTILLIITDGVINDIEPTKAAIVQASTLPLSIIIVGVGNADFTEMNVLDSDDSLLKCNGKSALRDIVQFVSFREVAHKGTNAIAQEVLAEVPTQLLQYMKLHGISPMPKAAATPILSGTAIY